MSDNEKPQKLVDETGRTEVSGTTEEAIDNKGVDSSKLVARKKPPVWLFIVIGVVVLVVVTSIVILIAVGGGGGKADRKINAAEKYLSKLDYESAIASYREAIEIDPACLEAYMGLADVYMTMADNFVGKAAKYADEGKMDKAQKAYEEAIVYYEEALNVIEEAIDNVSDDDKDTAEKKKEEIEKALEEAEQDKAETDSDDGENAKDDGDNGSPVSGEEEVDDRPRETDDFTNSYVGGIVIFGVYEQDGDLTNGPEPIEWEVLDINENGMLLVSKYVLDCVKYNTEYEDVTWEACTLRSWMNSDFYTTAFDAREQARINTTYVVNNDNSYYGTEGGNDTYDKVFCLSLDEILKYYPFNSWYSDYQWGFCQRLVTEVTPYVVSRMEIAMQITNEDYNDYLAGVGYSTDVVGKEAAWWWLRSPGKYSCSACLVYYFGIVGAYDSCYDIVFDYCGVRPALYVQQ